MPRLRGTAHPRAFECGFARRIRELIDQVTETMGMRAHEKHLEHADAGCDAHIAEPFKKATLLAAIRSTMRDADVEPIAPRAD